MNQKKPALSASPKRNTFQRDSYIERQLKEGRSLDDPDVKAMIDWYNSWSEESEKQEADPEWQKNNLEYDLRSTDWIVEKVRDSESYAQNLYAALCNNDFQRQDVWPVLKDQKYTSPGVMLVVSLLTCVAKVTILIGTVVAFETMTITIQN